MDATLKAIAAKLDASWVKLDGLPLPPQPPPTEET